MNFIKTFFYTFGTKLLSILILLGSRLLTARMLGPADFGALTNALNFITIISRWGSLGIGPATQFTAAKYPEKKHTLFVYVILASILTGTLSFGLLNFFIKEIYTWQFREVKTTYFVYQKLIQFLPLVILSLSLPILILGSGQIKKYSLTQLLPLLLQSFIVFAAYLQSHPIDYLIITNIIYWFSSVIITLVFIQFKHFRFRFDYDLMVIFTKYGIKSWPQVILQFGVSRMAVLIGAQYLSSEDLGYYILASNVSESLLIVYNSANPLIFNKTSLKGANHLLLYRTIRFSNIFYLAAALTLTFLGKPVFLFLFGEAFAASWHLLLLLLLSVFFYGMMRLYHNYFLALNRNGTVTMIQAIQLFILTASSMLLCPEFGAIGLCVSCIITSAFGMLISMFLMNRIALSQPSVSMLFVPDKKDLEDLKIFLKQRK